MYLNNFFYMWPKEKSSWFTWNFLGGNVLFHVVIFGNIMAWNVLDGNFLGRKQLKPPHKTEYESDYKILQWNIFQISDFGNINPSAKNVHRNTHLTRQCRCPWHQLFPQNVAALPDISRYRPMNPMPADTLSL